MSMINHSPAFPEPEKRQPFTAELRSSGEGLASGHRAQMVLVTFGLVAAVCAAVITLRLAVWLPLPPQ